MTAELADRDRIGFAIQANIVHDILAATDTVLDIGVEVIAYLFVVGEIIQGDLGEGQKAGDLLQKTR